MRRETTLRENSFHERKVDENRAYNQEWIKPRLLLRLWQLFKQQCEGPLLDKVQSVFQATIPTHTQRANKMFHMALNFFSESCPSFRFVLDL